MRVCRLDVDPEMAAMSASDSWTQTREELVGIFMEHNPRKVSEVDMMLKEWGGKEAELLAAVKRKYLHGLQVPILEEELVHTTTL